ncbi:DUF1573 domain-containing protein [Parabacteroides sp. Marseille-P3160]|uniref:DUF1573 domain-containing protein n=1 Tax=Parabacteroides sp. Marseille-P3160 TaxID=1917887 RepID=UPI0009BA23E2|nr:DUF1573 domain-containing protein [Parabacteroides sp. Marseille-P3160]
MKRLVFVFMAILLAAGVASAQQKSAAIVASETTHDFGDIKESAGPVSYTFKIKNEGEVPLVITRVVASCGCTTPAWSKEPIAPSKGGEIKVTFDPNGRPGPFTKPVSVYSNGKTGSYILTIKGNVIQ